MSSSLILKSKETCSSEISADFQKTTWLYIPEYITLYLYTAGSQQYSSTRQHLNVEDLDEMYYRKVPD
jgi:hypothetical protein